MRTVVRSVAWTVALAILLQGWLGAPLALRMAIGDAAAAPADALALCHGEPQADRHRDGGKQSGHDHEHCLLCKSNIGPPLIATVPVVAPRAPSERPAGDLAPCVRPAQRLWAQYRSRAPPVNA